MSSDTPIDDKLERYLDGLMTDQESSDFLESIDADELAKLEALQDQIDASLVNLVQVTPLDEEAITRKLVESDSVSGSMANDAVATKDESAAVGRRSLLRIALAASLLLLASLAVKFYVGDGHRVNPIDGSRSLAAVYQECVKGGFTPYYNCEEEERFANTFNFQFGQPLALAQMPAGSRMLGLSRLGGVSRNSIAMLCEVDGNKVIVFVDKSDSNGIDAATSIDSSDLSVFVEKKNGLVFCEVTPLKASKMIEHFRFIE